jgi:hypothetical protein
MTPGQVLYINSQKPTKVARSAAFKVVKAGAVKFTSSALHIRWTEDAEPRLS